MTLSEILLLGIGLSMDAFAVSVCKGLALRRISWKEMGLAGAWFGFFQGLMPAIGYLCGSFFAGWIESFSSWAGFLLLALIGGNMIRESFEQEDEKVDGSMKPAGMLMLAIATSIDALAVGLTFAVVPVRIFSGFSRPANTMLACVLIGAETFFLSAAGVKIGALFGAAFKSRAELAGGLILIAIGVRILLSCYGVL